MNKKYGLFLDKTKVIGKINKSRIFYSAEMNKIYPNKRLMYNEIYNVKGVYTDD